MKEKNIIIILVVLNVIVYGLFGVCSFKEARAKSDTQSEAQTESTQESTTAKDTTQTTTKKERETTKTTSRTTTEAKAESTGNVYLDKYNQGVSDSVSYEDYEADKKYTSASDRLKNAKAYYAIWDDNEGNTGLLNVVYKGVRASLSSSQKAELKSSEIAWIKSRDSEVSGLSGAAKYLKLAELSKDRTKWILDTYSK